MQRGRTPDAVDARSVGVGVKWRMPSHSASSQLDEVEGVADRLGAEAEVLVNFAGRLPVEVDVEHLSAPAPETPWWNDRPDIVSWVRSG